ncbi:hypothetical protein ABT186_05190 [Streptomyces sp. NPDC001634]|uniref:hypothetical protein n=1 Tax=Streptomyces sp. NPDC001634 TaxID=3154390 RepID=UPI0033313937
MSRPSLRQEPSRQRTPWVKAAQLDEDDDLHPEPYPVGIARWRHAMATRYARSTPARIIDSTSA